MSPHLKSLVDQIDGQIRNIDKQLLVNTAKVEELKKGILRLHLEIAGMTDKRQALSRASRALIQIRED